MTDKTKEKKYFHSSGIGFKEQLEAVFRRYRAGKAAEELLESGEYGPGAIYVPSYCLAVSPHIKGRTRRTRIEPLFYPYEFLNDSDTIFWKKGVNEVEWRLPKIHGTVLEGKYNIVVGPSKKKLPEAEYWIATGAESAWSEESELQLAVHRKNPDFQKIPGNINLPVLTKKEVTRLLHKLVEDKEFVRNNLFPELTRPWAEDIVRKIPIPEALREVLDKQDNLQELNTILLDGLEKFSSASRPRTTWTKWADLYGRRGILRRTDAHTQYSHDVMRVKRFMSHHPNIKDPSELRKLWIIKNELRTLRLKYPHLSETELIALVDVETAKCSISLENFRKALEEGGRKVSIEASVSQSSENLTIADRLETPTTVEDEAFSEEEIALVVETLIKGSGLSPDKIRAGIQKTASGYKMESKTKEMLFSSWLESGEKWDNKTHRQRAMTRAYSDLTTRGKLNDEDRIEKVWDTKEVEAKGQTSLQQSMLSSISPKMLEAIRKSRYAQLQGIYILAATGILGLPKTWRTDLLPCMEEIAIHLTRNGLSMEKVPVAAKSDSYVSEYFDIVSKYFLTKNGFEMIMNSPYDLKTTMRTLKTAGILGEPRVVSAREAKLSKLIKIINPVVEIEKDISDEEFALVAKKVRQEVTYRN